MLVADLKLFFNLKKKSIGIQTDSVDPITVLKNVDGTCVDALFVVSAINKILILCVNLIPLVYALLSLFLSFSLLLLNFVTVGPIRSTGGRSFFTDSQNGGLDEVNLSESQTSKFLRGPVR